MILFEKDWQHYPDAIVHTSTENDSFLHLAGVFKKMGVRNYYFPLALMQPQLEGVDPHADDLSMETKTRISLECEHNPWYFLREVVRVPARGSPHPSRFRASRGNIALFWCYLNHIDIALIQPRQTGKSVGGDVLNVWLIYEAAINAYISLLTLNDNLRKENVDRMKRIRDLLPGYLVNMTKADSDNHYELTCKARGNSYVTTVAQSSEAAANKLGRGLSSPTMQIDEGPFIPFIGTTIPAMLASGTAAREEAAAHGQPYGNIYTTTAGKKDDRDGRYMYDMIFSGAVWSERFYDATDEQQLAEMVSNNGSGRKTLVNATFSHRQLGYTDEWLYDTMAKNNAYGDEANRDYFNVWTSGTQSSPLTPEMNEQIRASEQQIQFHEICRNNYMIRWYIREDEIEQRMNESYFAIGLDTSDAVNRDNIAMVITDLADLSTVAAGTFNETSLIHFSNFIADLLIRFPNTILVPERRGSGQTIIDAVLIRLPKEGIDPFRRIYNRIFDEASEREREFKEVSGNPGMRSQQFYDRHKAAFGLATGAKSRELLYEQVLQQAAKNSSDRIKDETLSREIRGLVVKKGRIDHRESAHDDMVIAWLLTHWFVTMTRNLSFYGIDTSLLFRRVGKKKQTDDPVEMADAERQEQYHQEINEIYERLKEPLDEMSVTKLERRLRVLESRLTDQDEDASSIDTLIEQAADKRKAAARMNARRRQGLDRDRIWG